MGGCQNRATALLHITSLYIISLYYFTVSECVNPAFDCNVKQAVGGRPPRYAPRPATEARSRSLEPGRPSRARSAITRHPAGRPHTPQYWYYRDHHMVNVHFTTQDQSFGAIYPCTSVLNQTLHVSRTFLRHTF